MHPGADAALRRALAIDRGDRELSRPRIGRPTTHLSSIHVISLMVAPPSGGSFACDSAVIARLPSTRPRWPERAYMDILKNVMRSILRRHTSRWMTTFRGVTTNLAASSRAVRHASPGLVDGSK